MKKFLNIYKFSYHILSKTWWWKENLDTLLGRHESWNDHEYKITLNIPNLCNIRHAPNTLTKPGQNHLIQNIVSSHLLHVSCSWLTAVQRLKSTYSLLMYGWCTLKYAPASLIKACDRSNFWEQQSRLRFNRISMKQEGRSRESSWEKMPT